MSTEGPETKTSLHFSWLFCTPLKGYLMDRDAFRNSRLTFFADGKGLKNLAGIVLLREPHPPELLR
jgi:hypothetical protein